VRVPIPVVLFLVLAVVGGIWWKNTRHMDFLKEPSVRELEQTRLGVEKRLAELVQLPIPQIPELLPPPPPPEPAPPVVPENPIVDLGDLKSAVTLQDYAKLVPQGAGALIELAMALEARGELMRASLAWERVVDLSKPTTAQLATALSAIKRLRPTLPDWNTKPESAITLRLQVTVGKKLSKALTENLRSLAKSMESASSKIVKIETKVSTTKSSKTQNALLVSMAGTTKKPTTSESITTAATPETLRHDILKAVFRIVANHLRETSTYSPVPAMNDGGSPQEALEFHVTRLCWQEFANGMNIPPKKKE
jgi:hypothetical protein